MHTHRRSWAIVLAVLVVSAIAGCVSSTPASSSATASGSAATATSSQLAQTPAASRSPTETVVDLVFTGTKAFVAKGSAGRCRTLTMSDGSVSFGFEATEADYRGLGLSYSMANLSGDYVDIKWVIDAQTAYGLPADGKAILSADHHSVQIDTELSPGQTPGAPLPGPEHVSGTISCP